MKTIFRWTIGNSSKIGYECLDLSIRMALKLYKDRFDYCICYNNSNIQILREIVGHRQIKLIEQKWNDCALPIDYEKNKGTSLWKFCPARLNVDCHEIICDNDIILINHSKSIENFLSESKVLLVEDPIKFQGKFRHCFDENEKYNAGFIGIPPKYDFHNFLNETWKENGSPEIIDQGDEQGLTTATLKKEKFIKVSKNEILLVHALGETLYYGYDKEKNINNFGYNPVSFFENNNVSAYHFVGLNKTNCHPHWELFKKILKKKLTF